MRIVSYSLIFSLALHGFAIPAASANDDVCATDTFTPNAKNPDEIKEKCATASLYKDRCVETREKILKWSQDYKKIAEDSCNQRNKSLGKVNELSQSSSHAEVASTADEGIRSIQKLIEANNEILKAVPLQAERNVSALNQLATPADIPPDFKKRVKSISDKFNRAKSRPEVLDDKNIFTPSDISSLRSHASTANESKAQILTLSQSQEFVRALLLDKKKNEQAISQLTEAKNNALANQNRTQTAGENPKDSSSGFNPMNLLPLAAPLAGLLMQQKAQDSGLSDSMMPTPGVSEPAPKAQGTSFTEPNSSSQNPPASPLADTKGPDTDMTNPGEAYAGGNEYVEPVGGDISQGNGENRGGLIAGGFSANSPGGSSDSSGGSMAGSKPERKPANAAAANGEDTAIAAGGGGGGLNFADSASGEGESDGGMKDMLQDMEATLEDVPTGLFAEAEEAGSKSEIGAQDGDSLFPRVKACYVRNLKKGFVLNGLGEKLPDSD